MSGTAQWFILFVEIALMDVSLAQTVTIDPVGAVTVVEGSNLAITCSVGMNEGSGLILRENNLQLVEDNTPPTQANGSVRIFQLPVDRTNDGNTYNCLHLFTARSSLLITLTVIYPPVYSLLPNQTTNVLEGDDFTYPFGFEAKPTPTNFTWSRDGQVISSGDRIATSVSTISITSTTRSDSGVYEVVSYNEAGRGAANVTLDVQYLPEYANTAPVQHLQLILSTSTRLSFTLNCTLSAANPPVYNLSIEVGELPVTSSDTVLVTGNVVTIPSVQRSHSGNYSCNATNAVGSVVIYSNLLVVGVPIAPRAIASPVVGLSAAQLTWTAPEDDGGVSDPSWDPAIDGKQNTTTLTYTVTLTNGKDTTTVMTEALSYTVSNLQHSTAYTVTVVAENVYGKGPEVTTTFSTVTDLLSAVVGLSVALGVALLFAGALSMAILLHLCTRKYLSCSKGEADRKLKQALPKSDSKFRADPEYELCEGDMTGSNFAMEENPAYQSVDEAVAKPAAVETSSETN